MKNVRSKRAPGALAPGLSSTTGEVQQPAREKQPCLGVVTTTPEPPKELRARAHEVSRLTGWAVAPRRNITVSRLRRNMGAELAYVVRRDAERLEDGTSALWVHPGLLPLKRRDGLAHPLIRAVGGDDKVERVLDASLGLAGDALHLAAVVGVDVIGYEASPIVAALAQAGVTRMAAEGRWWSEAAKRVEVRTGDVGERLAEHVDDAVDVVYFDPMFETMPAGEKVFGEPHGYSIFRRVALATAIDEQTVREALRVAKRRVVLKLPGAAPPPEVMARIAPERQSRVRGRAVDYLVVDAR